MHRQYLYRKNHSGCKNLIFIGINVWVDEIVTIIGNITAYFSRRKSRYNLRKLKQDKKSWESVKTLVNWYTMDG